MNFVMVSLHAADPEESIAFYKKLGFKVHADDIDGEGKRYVRLSHNECPGILLNLKNEPYLLAYRNVKLSHKPPPKPVALSLVVEDYMQWLDAVEQAEIQLEEEVIEPWGVWLYLRDPSNNLICITNRDLW